MPDTRRLTLSLGVIARAGLDREAQRLNCPLSDVLQLAALYYAGEQDSGRLAVRVPRFVRDLPPDGDGLTMDLELEGADWGALERAARVQQLSLETLLAHAALLYLADLDSGTAADRFFRDPGDKPGPGTPGS